MLVLADALHTGLLARNLLYAVARPLPGPARMSWFSLSLHGRLGAMERLGAHDERVSVRTGHAHPFAFCPPAIMSGRPGKLSSLSSYEGIYLISCDCTVQAITTFRPGGPRSAVQTVVDAEARAHRRAVGPRRHAALVGEAERAQPSLVPPIHGLATRSIVRRTKDRSRPALLVRGACPRGRRISLAPGHDSTNLSVRASNR